MTKNVLVAGQKYKGLYVALKSFQENKVVASGKEPVAVFQRAQSKGISSPVIVYVPEKELSHVY